MITITRAMNPSIRRSTPTDIPISLEHVHNTGAGDAVSPINHIYNV